MKRSFDATMKYLQDHGIISSQADLARLLGIKTATVTGMKQRGSISENNIEKIAKMLAESRGERPEVIMERLCREIPEVAGQAQKGALQTAKHDYCQPSKAGYDKFIGDIPTYKVRFSDLIAANKEIIKKHGGCEKIVYMSYMKTNLEPDIQVNDTLIVKITSSIEGEGYYLFDCEYDLDIKYLRFSSTEKELVSISTSRNGSNTENKPVIDVANSIIGKILYLHREI